MSEPVTFKPHQAFSYAAAYLPDAPIILEAGACMGHDTLRMLTQWPDATIHAFEPVPYLFEQLSLKTAELPRVHRYPYALSDHDGSAQLYVAEKPQKPGIPSQASSLLKPKERLNHSPILFPRTITVPTISPASWVKRYNIKHIDFLWLDMQGNELAVLKAFPQELLALVQAIHTEVSFIESYEGIATPSEIQTWLEARGFILRGKDFPDTTTHFFGNLLFSR